MAPLPLAIAQRVPEHEEARSTQLLIRFAPANVLTTESGAAAGADALAGTRVPGRTAAHEKIASSAIHLALTLDSRFG